MCASGSSVKNFNNNCLALGRSAGSNTSAALIMLTTASHTSRCTCSEIPPAASVALSNASPLDDDAVTFARPERYGLAIRRSWSYSPCVMMLTRASTLRALKGGTPQYNSYIITPKLQTSEVNEYFEPSSASGER